MYPVARFHAVSLVMNKSETLYLAIHRHVMFENNTKILHLHTLIRLYNVSSSLILAGCFPVPHTAISIVLYLYCFNQFSIIQTRSF